MKIIPIIAFLLSMVLFAPGLARPAFGLVIDGVSAHDLSITPRIPITLVPDLTPLNGSSAKDTIAMTEYLRDNLALGEFFTPLKPVLSGESLAAGLNGKNEPDYQARGDKGE